MFSLLIVNNSYRRSVINAIVNKYCNNKSILKQLIKLILKDELRFAHNGVTHCFACYSEPYMIFSPCGHLVCSRCRFAKTCMKCDTDVSMYVKVYL